MPGKVICIQDRRALPQAGTARVIPDESAAGTVIALQDDDGRFIRVRQDGIDQLQEFLVDELDLLRISSLIVLQAAWKIVPISNVIGIRWVNKPAV